MTGPRVLFEDLETRILLDVVPLMTETYGPTLVDDGGVNYTANDSGTFDIPQFDEQGGSRTLRSVEIQIGLNSFGGAHIFENESATPANVDLTIGTEADTFRYGAAPGEVFTLTVLANDSTSVVVPADNGVFPPVLGDGDDTSLVGGSPTDSDSDTLTAPGDDLSLFIGGGNLTISFDSMVAATLVADVGDFISGVNPAPTFNMTYTVIYTYIPPPSLAITKGVISAQEEGEFTPATVGPVSFTSPGSAGVRYGVGEVVHTTNHAADPVDSDLLLIGPEIGDLISFAVVIENSGGNELGAFDVQIIDTIPQGLAIPTGGLNLTITDGARNAIAFTPVDGGFVGPAENALFDAQGIELTDPGPGAAIESFNPDDNTTGENIAVLTYDLQVVSNIIDRVLINTASVTSVAGLEGGANLLGAPISDPATVRAVGSFQYDVFNNFAIRGGTRRPFDPPPSTVVQPMYSGTAEPGTTLAVSVFDRRGNLIGSETTVADAGGNWFANFFKTAIRDEPHSIVIRQMSAGYGGLADSGFNLRTYYTPAIQGGTFIAEHLTVENVMGKRASVNAMGALLSAGYYPIVLGWQAWSFDILPASATPSGI